MMTDDQAHTTWPYCPRSGILSRREADDIRTWALTCMTEAELRSYSQQQLFSMYLYQHLVPTLQRVAPWVDPDARPYGDTWTEIEAAA